MAILKLVTVTRRYYFCSEVSRKASVVTTVEVARSLLQPSRTQRLGATQGSFLFPNEEQNCFPSKLVIWGEILN